MDDMDFGKRLKAVRKDRELTADKLSELCGIDATYLRQIEGGTKTPSLQVFTSLCNKLKISPDYLLQDSLEQNEISDIRQLEELWRKAPPSRQSLVIALLECALEWEDN